MQELFDRVTPQFTDFILLALLQLVMHVLTALESVRVGKKSNLHIEEDRKDAATWSFIGAILTLIAGIIAKSLPSRVSEGCALAIPTFCIGKWAFSYWRCSKFLDGLILEAELKDFYRNKILEAFDGKGASTLEPSAIVRLVNENMPIELAFIRRARRLKKIMPVSFGELCDRWLPTEANLSPFLNELALEGKLVKSASGAYSRK